MSRRDATDVHRQLRISCADALELATDHLEQALDPADAEDYLTHLSLCQGCQVFLDQVRTTVHVTGHLRGRPATDALADRLAERLRRRRGT